MIGALVKMDNTLTKEFLDNSWEYQKLRELSDLEKKSLNILLRVLC